MSRSFQRQPGDLRPVTLQPDVSRYAEGSCLVTFGNTRVLCTASVDDFVPPFLRNTGKGWVTAEYGMLPRATHSRNPREAAKGKQSGRTQEIQRLIGRSLRTSIDLARLGERQIIVDCDVIEADGGTRTASITGGYVALYRAIQQLMKTQKLKVNPMLAGVAAISCGVLKGAVLLDLDYDEDSAAEVDANVIMTEHGRMVEVQMSGEEGTFDDVQMAQMIASAKHGIAQLVAEQKRVLGLHA
jgi:ribonuclease PH